MEGGAMSISRDELLDALIKVHDAMFDSDAGHSLALPLAEASLAVVLAAGERRWHCLEKRYLSKRNQGGYCYWDYMVPHAEARKVHPGCGWVTVLPVWEEGEKPA